MCVHAAAATVAAVASAAVAAAVVAVAFVVVDIVVVSKETFSLGPRNCVGIFCVHFKPNGMMQGIGRERKEEKTSFEVLVHICEEKTFFKYHYVKLEEIGI